MKTFYHIMILSLLLMTACANTHIPKAKVTFRVINQDGVPIVGEPARVGFYPKDTVHGKTDVNGYFTAEGRTASDYLFAIGRLKVDEPSPKYYATYFRKDIAHWKDYPKDGKWKPWNETIEVMVKEKLNPIPMYACSSDFNKSIPKINAWIGYDFEKNDWLTPYGNGIIADIEVKLDAVFYDDGWQQVFAKIRFPYPLSGAYIMKKDQNSDLKSVYCADSKHVYEQEISFYDVIERPVGVSAREIKKDSPNPKRLSDDEYIIFRTRTEIDCTGKLTSARYGKIYGPIKFYLSQNSMKGYVEINRYYFNPNVNDTNLECNGTSLIKVKGVRRVAP